jgi:hypothetical protein
MLLDSCFIAEERIARLSENSGLRSNCQLHGAIAAFEASAKPGA